MGEETIFRLKSLTAQTADTKNLIQAIYESVDIIAPWMETTYAIFLDLHFFDISIRSDNGALQNLMDSLRVEAKEFIGSVTQNYDTAQSGYEFALTAENMCKHIRNDRNTDVDIQDLIMEMREIAH